MLLVSIVLFYFGLNAMLVSRVKYHRPVLSPHTLSPKVSRAYWWSGWLLVAVSSVLCIAFYGWAVGITAICGWLTLTGTALTLLHAFKPRWVIRTLYWTGI